MRVLIGILACLFVPATVSAQHEYPATDVENGGRLFLGTCAACHGPDGDASRDRQPGPRAVPPRHHGRGSGPHHPERHPGTGMPANNVSEVNAANIVAYLRTIAADTRSTSAPGDRARGQAIFEGKGACTSCHRVGRSRIENRSRPDRRRRPAPLRRARKIDCRPRGIGPAEPAVLPRPDP